MKRFASCALLLTVSAISAAAANLMYIGTLDKKLLVIDEDKEEVWRQFRWVEFRVPRPFRRIIRSSTS